MHRMEMTVVLALLAFSSSAAPAEVQVARRTEARTWQAPDGGVFRYRWREPASPEPGKKYPLVILMHGVGECGTNNFSQLKWGALPIFTYLQNKREEFYFVAGQVPQGQRWVDTDWGLSSHVMPETPSKTMALQIAFLEELFAKTPALDLSRVYVTGVSMGGFGTWDLICRKPEWFAAAMPVCGGGDTAQAPKIRNIPIWVYHGDRDDAVSCKRSRSMTAALWACDGNVKYTEYPGVDHFCWYPAYGNARNLDWFFSQKKSELKK